MVSINSNSTAATLTELAALGAQDTLLTCDPKCSLFQQSYCRITNFAMGEQTLQFQGAPSGNNWSAASSLRAEVLRAGDLLGPVYLDFTVSKLPVSTTSVSDIYMPGIGYGIIEESKVIIGSQEFESCTGEYFMMHDEISRSEGHRASKLIGDYGSYLRSGAISDVGVAGSQLSAAPSASDEETIQRAIQFSSRTQSIFAPLPHFWTKHPGNYMNIVGMQYHNMVFEMKTRAFSDLARKITVAATSGAITLASGALPPATATTGAEGVLSGLSLLAVYVQLDTAERRLKAQAAQTVRFVYTQHTSYSTVASDAASTKQVSNYFNHPVTRFVWGWRSAEAEASKQWFRFGGFAGRKALRGGLALSQEVIPESTQFELSINNNSRVHQAAEYFLYAQPYQSAKRVPSRIVYSYAIAAHPESEDIYSGSMNLSRIDNFVVSFTFRAVGNTDANQLGALSTGVASDTVDPGSTTGKIFFHAETINFYKQSSGMLGLLFAN